MAALTADRPQKRRGDGIVVSYPVAASTKIYKGSLVCINTSGYAVPAADTSGFKIGGVAEDYADNSSGSAADISVACRLLAEFDFVLGSGLAQADVGANVFVQDDQTVNDAAAQTNDVKVGTLTGVNGSVATVLVGRLSATDS